MLSAAAALRQPMAGALCVSYSSATTSGVIAASNCLNFESLSLYADS